MRGVVLAWAVGLGVIFWREARVYRKPPAPGRLLAASGAFGLLALLGTYPQATTAANLAAWGLDLAVILAPGTIPGTSAPKAAPKAQAQSAGG